MFAIIDYWKKSYLDNNKSGKVEILTLKIQVMHLNHVFTIIKGSTIIRDCRVHKKYELEILKGT